MAALLLFLACAEETEVRLGCVEDAYQPSGEAVSSGLDCPPEKIPFWCHPDVCDGREQVTCESSRDLLDWVERDCWYCKATFLADASFAPMCWEETGD